MNRPEVIALFARQHWVASTSQLIELGVAASTIHRHKRKGSIVAVAPTVVAPAAVALDFEGRAVALQLAGGAETFVSGPSAGVLHGLRAMPREPVEITTREDRRVAMPPWGRLVRTSWIDEDRDVLTRADGMRVASPLRTLFALARRFNQHRFERAAEDVWHRGLASPADAAAYLAAVRRQGRTGVARFEAWLDKTALRTRPSQSGLELFFAELVERAGLPTPERQHPLVLLSGETIHVDLAWPDVQLGLEPGHSWWHGGDVKARADAARDRACDEIGWRIVRHEESAREDPAGNARQLARIFHQRAALFRAAARTRGRPA